jgi:hypothetical protein
MTYFEEDFIVAEVRKNRADLLAEFGGDTKKLINHLISQRPQMEAAGWRYETENEIESRKAWHRQQQDMEQRRMEAI